MARNPSCTVYVGNLDERVTDRILYEILVQVGRVVGLHMPVDKETNHHKGYAFAEYESEDIAKYSVMIFSGVVRLYNKTLKFGMSGQDKPCPNTGTPVTPKINSTPIPKPTSLNGREVEMLRAPAYPTDCGASVLTSPATPRTNSMALPRLKSGHGGAEVLRSSTESTDSRISAYPPPVTPLSYPIPLPRKNPFHGREVMTLRDSPRSTDRGVSTRGMLSYALQGSEMTAFPGPSQSINCRFSAHTHSSPRYPRAFDRGFTHDFQSPDGVQYGRQVFDSLLIPTGNHSDAGHPVCDLSYRNCSLPR